MQLCVNYHQRVIILSKIWCTVGGGGGGGGVIMSKISLIDSDNY